MGVDDVVARIAASTKESLVSLPVVNADGSHAAPASLRGRLAVAAEDLRTSVTGATSAGAGASDPMRVANVVLRAHDEWCVTAWHGRRRTTTAEHVNHPPVLVQARRSHTP